MMRPLQYNPRDLMVKDAKKINKSGEKTNYLVVDGKNTES